MRTTITLPALGTSLLALALLAAPAQAAPAQAAPARAAAPPKLADCGPGELCLWKGADFKGERQTFDLSGTDIESCVALPDGGSAQALVNRTGRPVTAYQSEHCAETGEFTTYPGDGTWAPRTPYRVRAFKIWEN